MVLFGNQLKLRTLSPDANAVLRSEGARLGKHPDRLALELLEAVLRHGLVSAVLDSKD